MEDSSNRAFSLCFWNLWRCQNTSWRWFYARGALFYSFFFLSTKGKLMNPIFLWLQSVRRQIGLLVTQIAGEICPPLCIWFCLLALALPPWKTHACTHARTLLPFSFFYSWENRDFLWGVIVSHKERRCATSLLLCEVDITNLTHHGPISKDILCNKCIPLFFFNCPAIEAETQNVSNWLLDPS